MGAVRNHGSMSTDGRLLAVVVDAGEAHVLRLDEQREPWILTGHEKLASAEVSPDGRWIATAAWQGRGVKIWDARTRKLARDLPVPGTAGVEWSPDGRLLATSLGKENLLWDSGSWEVVRRFERVDQGDLPGPLAFSPDGALLALAHSRTAIQLVDPATGETLAIFEPPDLSYPTVFRFTPDGTRLVVGGHPAHLLHVWDLALIRRRLREMRLDWDRPPYPVLPSEEITQPLRIQADLGHLALPAPG
jgi:WD40 repeat protein